MMDYAIAYFCKDSKDLIDEEPAVIDDLDSYDEAVLIQKLLKSNGLKNATVFWYDEVLPTVVTWPFVYKHKLNT